MERTFSEIRRAGRNESGCSGTDEGGLYCSLAGRARGLAGEIGASPGGQFVRRRGVTCGAGQRVEPRYDAYSPIRTSTTEIYLFLAQRVYKQTKT